MGEGERHENSAVTGNPGNIQQRHAVARLDGPMYLFQHLAGGSGVVEACLTLGNSTAALESSSSRKGGGRRSGWRRRALSTGWGTRLRAGTLGVLESLLLGYGIKDFGCCFTRGPTRGGRDAASREGPLAGPKVPLEDPAAAEDDDEDNEEAEDKEDEDDAAMGGAVTLAYEEDNVDADEEDDAEDDADTAVQGEATGAMPAEDPPEGAAI